MKPSQLQFKLSFVKGMTASLPIILNHGNNVLDLIGWQWPALGIVLNRCGCSGQFGTN